MTAMYIWTQIVYNLEDGSGEIDFGCKITLSQQTKIKKCFKNYIEYQKEND